MNPRSSALPITVPRISLASHVVEVIQREVAAGRWSRGLPSERALCSLFQVSRTTVRAALAEAERRGCLRRDNRGRPEPARRRDHSRPARPAEVVILAPIGLEQSGRFELLWFNALREQLAGQRVSLQFVHRPRAFAARPAPVLEELTAHYCDATWVLLRSSRAMQEWFFAQRKPAIVAGSRHEGVKLPCVEIDVEAAARHAAHYLVSTGHRRLAFFIEPSASAGPLRSEAAFREGARGAEAAEVVRHGSTRADFLRAFARRLASPAPPTGFFIDRSTHALSALTWLLRTGVTWPGQFALLSRDDTASLEHTTPAISSYRFDAVLFARKAARLLLGLLGGGSLRGSENKVQPKFMRRETTR